MLGTVTFLKFLRLQKVRNKFITNKKIKLAIIWVWKYFIVFFMLYSFKKSDNLHYILSRNKKQKKLQNNLLIALLFKRKDFWISCSREKVFLFQQLRLNKFMFKTIMHYLLFMPWKLKTLVLTILLNTHIFNNFF